MVYLKQVRESVPMTTQELSDASGVAKSTINGIELGYHRPRPSTLRKLADAMNVDVREITRGPMVSVQLPTGMFGLMSVEDFKRLQGEK